MAEYTHFDPTPPTVLIESTWIHFNPPIICGSNQSTLNPLAVKFSRITNEIEAASNRIEALVQTSLYSSSGLIAALHGHHYAMLFCNREYLMYK